jgi:hypothetical protein
MPIYINIIISIIILYTLLFKKYNYRFGFYIHKYSQKQYRNILYFAVYKQDIDGIYKVDKRLFKISLPLFLSK